MNEDDLCKVSYNVVKSYSQENLKLFIDAVDKIKELISNSTDSYQDKLKQLKYAGVLKAFNEILQNSISTEIQFKLLRLFDFLIQTCSKREEIEILFKDGVTNSILTYPFDLTNIDVLQSYMTILKGISINLKIIPLEYIYSEAQHRCPIFDHAIAYIDHKDSTTIAAARFVVLKLFLCKIPELTEIISSPATKNHIGHLIEHLDPDGFVFIVDFLNIVPLELQEFTIEKIRSTIISGSFRFFAQAITYLIDSPAKSMLMEVIHVYLAKTTARDLLYLSVLLYCLNKNIILADKADKLGLIITGKYPIVQRFNNKQPPKQIQKGKLYVELGYILQQRTSLLTVALILRILENLTSGPPNIVKSVRHDVISAIRSRMSYEVFEMLSKGPQPRQRTDIEYILSSKGEQKHSEITELVLQLAEIEASMHRWKKESFQWFKLSDLESDYEQRFGIQDDKYISLFANEIELEENRRIRLWDAIIDSAQQGKDKKTVTIWIRSKDKNKTRSMLSIDKMRQVITFPTVTAASQFENELIGRQLKLCEEVLDVIEDN